MADIKAISYIAIILAFAFVSFQFLQFAHERSHQEIFSSYEIDSDIRFGVLKTYTEPEKIKISNEDYQNLRYDHNMADIIGYHMISSTIVIVMAMGILFYVDRFVLVKR